MEEISRRFWVNPCRAPEPLPILNPSNFVPKNGFPVVKGLRSSPSFRTIKKKKPESDRRALYIVEHASHLVDHGDIVPSNRAELFIFIENQLLGGVIGVELLASCEESKGVHFYRTYVCMVVHVTPPPPRLSVDFINQLVAPYIPGEGAIASPSDLPVMARSPHEVFRKRLSTINNSVFSVVLPGSTTVEVRQRVVLRYPPPPRFL